MELVAREEQINFKNHFSCEVSDNQFQAELDIKFGGRIKRAAIIDKLFGIASMP